jgi:cell wall-associated NlpC family hydrolase
MDGVRRPIRHANEFWEHYGVPVHGQRKLPGDLIVFARRKRHPNHIGIVASESTYIHSPGWPDEHVEIQEIVDEPIVYEPGQRGQYVCNPIGYKALVQVAARPTYRFPMRVIG